MTLHDWIADWSQWAWPLLGNHLWQATLITFIAALLAYTLRRGPARVRYWMWLSAAINLAVPVFALTLLGGKLGLLPVLYETPSETTTPIQVFYQVTAPIAQSFEGAAAGVPTPRGHSELFCFLTMVWFAGLIFFASLWVRSRMRFARALKAGRRVFAGKEFEILRRVQSWLFIGREVGLVLSPGIIEPGVWGIWRPVVILPETISSHLSDAELESVVMHELVHVLRRDNLISSFQMVVCCAFWFHPFSWLIDRRLLVERERACDERVIELGGRSQVYAASLLKVLRFCLGTKMAGVSAASGSNLRRRIEQIMADSENKSLSISQRVLVCTIAAVVIG
ncbi:MAG TPA: M56 family metallopeptidase, partial [Blastocatellia bacterium]|nr:M56 family metallopeptidase [Blastocatellia bacterium]